MSIQPRFYAPAAHHEGDLVTLPDDEAQHLTRVLRLTPGAAVRVFDGRGREFDAVVETPLSEHGPPGRAVTVRVGAARTPAPEARVAVTLVQALLKGDKMDDVVRDAVMLGVAAIQPVVSARSEVALAAVERGRRRQRWERIAVSASKQCGRAVLPAILQALTFDEVMSRVADGVLPSPAVMCVEPNAAGGVPLGEIDRSVPAAATLLIGPEGGWEASELAAAARCARVTLGHRTLRADAMAMVAMAALFTAWGEF